MSGEIIPLFMGFKDVFWPPWFLMKNPCPQTVFLIFFFVFIFLSVLWLRCVCDFFFFLACLGFLVSLIYKFMSFTKFKISSAIFFFSALISFSSPSDTGKKKLELVISPNRCYSFSLIFFWVLQIGIFFLV